MGSTAPHLRDWDAIESIQAKDHVQHLVDQPGWDTFLEAVRLRTDDIQRRLIAAPLGEAVDYADLAAHIRGLNEIKNIAQGIIDRGSAKEAELREKEPVA